MQAGFLLSPNWCSSRLENERPKHRATPLSGKRFSGLPEGLGFAEPPQPATRHAGAAFLNRSVRMSSICYVLALRSIAFGAVARSLAVLAVLPMGSTIAQMP